MTHEEEQLKRIADIKKMLDDGISKAEFLKSFENVIKVFLDAKKNLTDEHSVAVQSLTKLADKIADSNASDFSTFKKELSNVISKALKEQEDGMNFIRDKVRNLKDGHTPTHEEMMSLMMPLIPPPLPPTTPKEERDKLETLEEGEKLSIQAIDGLSKLLEELGTRITEKTSGGGGGLISKRIRFIDDETISGVVNGTNTVFTLSRTPETGSLKVYRGGSRQRVTEDYTFDGNKTITFTIAPQVGEILLADYRF